MMEETLSLKDDIQIKMGTFTQVCAKATTTRRGLFGWLFAFRPNEREIEKETGGGKTRKKGLIS